ncbi:MAG: exodeoxyribonuclease VII large subunit [Burkholderiales bacterium]|jgi:exodeoxyribonuclease VII large subunit|nr:exodeoxyribonuclease VII large subunit [Burkholderiales bacterium]
MNDLFSSEPLNFTVSQLIARARSLLEGHLGDVWVSGEISGLTRAASGHFYFVLKDDAAQVRCTLWRHKAQQLRLTSESLRDGMRVDARASATVFEARGELQLNISALKLSGQGALYERFLRLKARFEAEGLFSPDKKRAIPAFPRGIGVVTSPIGAAVRDIVITLKRRNPNIAVVIYPTLVQGEGAAESVARAIATASARQAKDGTEVLIVARGGGSLEDLWAFNEEAVVRAVASSALPVISGVGHETDTTLTDFVADCRAATPTAAAMLASPELAVLRDEATQRGARLLRDIKNIIRRAEERCDDMERHLKSPMTMLAEKSEALRDKANRLSRAWRVIARIRADQTERALYTWRNAAARFSRESEQLNALSDRLTLLNPEAVLWRGYAIVSDASGAIVTDADKVAVNDSLQLTLARGSAKARVTDVRHGQK